MRDMATPDDRGGAAENQISRAPPERLDQESRQRAA